jgi:hypothetical protein
VEVSPEAHAETDYFLNVMQVMDDGEATILPSERLDADRMTGAQIANRAVWFSKSGKRLNETLTLSVNGAQAEMSVVVADLHAGKWKITMPGQSDRTGVVSEEGGVLAFEAPAGTYTLMPVVDEMPPTTEAAIEGTIFGGWYTSDVTVTLTASDIGLGVARTETSVDGGASWQPYAAPIALNAEGPHAVLYRSVDAAGNVEQVRSVDVAIDRTAPEVIVSGEGVYSVDQTIRIACSASDTVSGVTYSDCAVPLVDSPGYLLTPGTHTVTASATDAAGYVRTVEAQYTVEVTTESLIALTVQWLEASGAGNLSNSFVTKLEKGQWDAYAHQVSAQRGKKLTEAHADQLLSLVQYRMNP